MITEDQFSILYYLKDKPGSPQRETAAACGLSLGSANTGIRQLTEQGHLADDALTPSGLKILDNFKVDNAVILAAGMSSRLAPLSYDKPKGLLIVKGEVMIERQIRQLQEAGISDITVVVGYMKEQFFYLKSKFGVDIVVNDEYNTKNNTSSIIRVKDKLKNTYIVYSDLYFANNVFKSHVYASYYPSKMRYGYSNDYGYTADRNGRITAMTTYSCDELGLVGEIYLDREGSSRFVFYLEKEYQIPTVQHELLDDILMRHLKDIELYTRVYDEDTVHQFDTFEELRAFDPDFIANIDSPIIGNICSALKCERNSITILGPLKTGYTNTSFIFEQGGRKYIYRHPGIGTETYINRKCEAFAEENAKRMGIDKTVIHIDHESGWKISHFIEGCRDMNLENKEELKKAMGLLKKLHDEKLQFDWDFNPIERVEEHINAMKSAGRNVSEFTEQHKRMQKLYNYTEQDGYGRVLCHNDTWYLNYLVNNDLFLLIDWEYAGMGDPSADVANFTAGVNFNEAQFTELCELYESHPLSEKEKRHFFGYRGLMMYYWFVWAVRQEFQGIMVGEYLQMWYEVAEEYSVKALTMYEQKGVK
ncbi:choline kinase [Spirochaetia bacterium]|nr:choline kinase [Spirochaetia bacterium]